MKKIGVAIIALGLTAAAGSWIVIRGRNTPKVEAAALNRQQVELTIYPQDFAQVSETRLLEVKAGSNKLSLSEVSRELDPQSVLFQWENQNEQSPQLVANTYDLGVGNSGQLLQRYLGKEVEVIRYGENGHEAERQTGTLMVNGNGETVLQTDDKFVIQPPGTIVAPINKEIVTIPQLSVQAESPNAQKTNLEMTYLTRGLSWSADYVATLAPGEDKIKLECWATVINQTGVNYPNAKVTLVVGTPNRAANPGYARASGHFSYPSKPEEEMGRRRQQRVVDIAGEPAISNVESSQAVGEFYAYPIKNQTTIVQEQMNRLLMLGSNQVPVKKDYNTRLPQLSAWGEYYEWEPASQPIRGNAQMSMSFYNKEANQLGMPLPQGTIRIYEPDKSGEMRYAGAATVRNTPKDQKIDLTLSRVFDMMTEWSMVKKTRINKKTVQKQVKVILKNEKNANANLRLVQPFYGKWKIVTASHPFKKLNANAAQWTIPVPAGGEKTLQFTVEMRE